MFQLEKLERIIRGDASAINFYSTLVIARVHKGG